MILRVVRNQSGAHANFHRRDMCVCVCRGGRGWMYMCVFRNQSGANANIHRHDMCVCVGVWMDMFGVSSGINLVRMPIFKQERAPEAKITLRVVAANNLPPMDTNGLCDPYVTLHCNHQVNQIKISNTHTNLSKEARRWLRSTSNQSSNHCAVAQPVQCHSTHQKGQNDPYLTLHCNH